MAVVLEGPEVGGLSFRGQKPVNVVLKRPEAVVLEGLEAVDRIVRGARSQWP